MNQEELSGATERAKKSVSTIESSLQSLIDTAERAEKWGKKTAAGALGLGVGLLVGVGIATTIPLSNELKPVVVGALGLVGMGGAVLIAIEIDERRQRIQKQEDSLRLEKVIELTLKRARDYPELAPSLLPKLNYDLQTESILLRGDAIGAVKVLPWNNDLPANPQQNTLPPVKDTENPA